MTFADNAKPLGGTNAGADLTCVMECEMKE